MGKPKISSEIKIKYVEMILEGKISIISAAKEIGIHKKSVQEWIALYKAEGRTGLIYTGRNKHYSKETKIAAVHDYLEGKGSYIALCSKYGIKSSKVLQSWTKSYNAHGYLKSTGGGFMMSRKRTRNTTYEERVEVVQYCLSHDGNYGETALKYDVTYQNVYQWVAKYKALGNPGLEDRRGKRLGAMPARTPEEELRAKIAQLEAKNQMLQMENDLLKKVEELSRKRFH